VGTEDRRSPAQVIAALAEAANAHDLDAFVGLFADDYDSRQPAHPDRAFRTILGVRAGRIAEPRLYLEPIEREGGGIAAVVRDISGRP
jgi:hypothetical protein